MTGFGIIESFLSQGRSQGLLANPNALSTLNNPDFVAGVLGSWVQDNAGKMIKLVLGEVAKQGVLQAIRGGG